MKAKKKRAGKRGASDARLGDFTAWMLYDATGTYTGSTLWPSRQFAEAEKQFDAETGKAPEDGRWRIRKVHVTPC